MCSKIIKTFDLTIGYTRFMLSCRAFIPRHFLPFRTRTFYLKNTVYSKLNGRAPTPIHLPYCQGYHRMSDPASDSFSGLDFPDFTEEDFLQIDAIIASQTAEDTKSPDASFQSEIYGLNLNLLTAEELAQLDAVGIEMDLEAQHKSQEIETANSSFQYLDGDLNLGTLSTIELASLDAAILKADKNSQAGPSIEIEIEIPQDPLNSAALPPLQQEELFNKMANPQDRKSPLQKFRSRTPLSVSDLVSPSWYVECASFLMSG